MCLLEKTLYEQTEESFWIENLYLCPQNLKEYCLTNGCIIFLSPIDRTGQAKDLNVILLIS